MPQKDRVLSFLPNMDHHTLGQIMEQTMDIMVGLDPIIIISGDRADHITIMDSIEEDSTEGVLMGGDLLKWDNRDMLIQPLIILHNPIIGHPKAIINPNKAKIDPIMDIMDHSRNRHGITDTFRWIFR